MGPVSAPEKTMASPSKKTAKKSRPRQKRITPETQNDLLAAIISCSGGDAEIFSLDKRYRYTAFNENHEKAMKKTWKADIAIGSNLLDIMKMPRWKEAAKKSIDTALRGEIVTETRHISEAGIFYEFFWKPIRLDKKIIGVACSIRNITEQWRAQEKLKQSEEKFRTVFYTSPDAITLSRLEDGMFVSVNKGFCLLSEYSEEEVIGKTSREINLWNDPIDRTKVIEALSTRGSIKNFEALFRKKNGACHNGLLSAAIIDVNGHRHILSVTRDINDRREAEAELKFKNALMTTQQEASIDGILIIDKNENVLSCNRRFADLWEIPREILETKSDERMLNSVLGKLVNPDEFIAKVKYLYKSRWETSRDEIELNDGRVFDRYSAPMFGADAEYYGRLWQFRDISRQKAAQDELKKQAQAVQLSFDVLENREKRTETIIDSMASGLLAVDNDLNIMLMNRKCAEIFSRKIPECIGKNIRFIITGNELDAMVLSLVQKSGATILEEDVSIAKDGDEVLYFKVHIAPIFDKSDVLIGKIMTFRDQTEKMRVEKFKRSFLNNVSHEMRTPLTSIVGMTELLKTEVSNADHKEYLEILTECENTLLSLVDEILDFSKIERGLLELHNSVFRIGDLCMETAGTFKIEAEKKGIVLTCEVDPKAFETVRGDKARLKQVMTGLLKNAIKFTHQGSVSYAVKLVKENDKMREYLFEIKDTGIGIAKTDSKLIFEEFVQLDGATSRRYEGIGLGLTLAKRLIELMNGSIWVESDIGKGSGFYFTVCMAVEN
jgi:PAS domain S-box-containing protein